MNYVSNDQIGAMAYFAGDYAPSYWMFCDGHSLRISDYSAVFAVFKGRYGADSSLFQVPSMAPLTSNGENLPAIFLAEGVYPENVPDELCFISPEPSDYPTYIGLVVPFDGSTPPANWIWCDGSMQQIRTFMALFAIVGTRFGGNGTSNFGLPNLPGYIICTAGDFPSRH